MVNFTPQVATVRRRGIELVKICARPIAPVLSPVGTWMSCVWTVAPLWIAVCVIMCLFVALSRPEVVAMAMVVLPFKIAAWLWTYVAHAASRFVAHVEQQMLSQLFGFTGYMAPSTELVAATSPDGQHPLPPAAPPTGLIGWALAVYMVARRQ